MREYRQYCGIAKALDVIGGRWTLLVVRELLLGPRRYGELSDALPGITSNLLASRLRQLEAAGVVAAVVRGDGRRAWALTETGVELKPALLALGAFGARWLGDPAGHHTSGRWFTVSLQRRYRGGLAPTTVGLEIDGAPFTLDIEPRELVSRDGWPDAPDVTLRGSLAAVAAALQANGEIPADVEVWGDRGRLAALRESLARLGSGPGSEPERPGGQAASGRA